MVVWRAENLRRPSWVDEPRAFDRSEGATQRRGPARPLPASRPALHRAGRAVRQTRQSGPSPSVCSRRPQDEDLAAPVRPVQLPCRIPASQIFARCPGRATRPTTLFGGFGRAAAVGPGRRSGDARGARARVGAGRHSALLAPSPCPPSLPTGGRRVDDHRTGQH